MQQRDWVDLIPRTRTDENLDLILDTVRAHRKRSTIFAGMKCAAMGLHLDRGKIITAAPDRSEYGFSGVIKEITPPERIVFTEGFAAMPVHDYLVTTTFPEQGNQTTIHVHLLYQSQADRDGHVGAGMERGMNETYDRLDEHLQTLKSAA